MKSKMTTIVSWIIVAWICKVFISSFPYKFTAHPDTLHIFGTIGEWMKGILSDGIGSAFANYGFYVVGVVELVTSVILLLPLLLWVGTKLGLTASTYRKCFHKYGGLLASAVMGGAVFFHLFTPLGIEVLHQGKSDNGTLFYAAFSILILGIVLFFLNSGKQES